jgi:hypothetical protein
VSDFWYISAMRRLFPLSLCLLLIGCASERVQQIAAEEHRMPSWENKWTSLTFVDDQSTPAQPPAQLDDYIAEIIASKGPDAGDYWKVENAEQTIRRLPDGTVLVVGKIPDYLAPQWLLHLSETGAVIGSHQGGSEFIGYVDGYAFVYGNFGDGGGFWEGIGAIDLKTGKDKEIYRYDSMLASVTNLDATFVPKNCAAVSANDDQLLMHVQELSEKIAISMGEILIGIPCKHSQMLIIPFSSPSHSLYGVAVKASKSPLLVETFTGTGSSVFPPQYVDDEMPTPILVHTFASEQDGKYSYFEQQIWPTEDKISSNVASISEDHNFRFCEEHRCPKGIVEIIQASH